MYIKRAVLILVHSYTILKWLKVLFFNCVHDTFAPGDQFTLFSSKANLQHKYKINVKNPTSQITKAKSSRNETSHDTETNLSTN